LAKACWKEKVTSHSIDPELLLSIPLIGYLYCITSERKLVEELRMRPARRWVTGLGSYHDQPDWSSRLLR
jgi:transposase